MNRITKRMLEELSDLYVEKIRQVNTATRTGNTERIGIVLAQYQRDRQRILDNYSANSK
jgi:hypothetical protein